MPTFGFSAFLKLVSLNTLPQRTLIRQRLASSRSEGYDFHRSLKLRAKQYLVEGITLADVLATIEDIKRIPERQSAQSGLQRLGAWRDQNTGRILSFSPVLYESPTKNFKIQYMPNFGIEMHGQKVAVHIWNTARPRLDTRMTYAALSLFPSLYADQEQRPDDVAVLSLPDARLYRLSEVGDHSEVGRRLVRRLDDLFEEIRHEPPKPKAPKDRPTAPPPPAK